MTLKNDNEMKVFVVHLRKPARNKGEMRSDPFWEFGSFGCTKCHSRNLLHPKNAGRLEGARLAFAQGGKFGFKLVLLTPPVKVVRWKDRCEVTWRPIKMPFKYADAPLLVSNDGQSDFPGIKRMAGTALRTTLMGGFSSRFRTRGEQLPKELAGEVFSMYNHKRLAAKKSMMCRRYEEALPYLPPLVDTNRAASYGKLLRQAKRGGRRSACGNTQRNRPLRHH